MKSKEGLFLIIVITLYCSWVIYHLTRPQMSPGTFPEITGNMKIPLDDPQLLYRFYKDLELVSPTPYIISPEVWLSCMAPTPQEEDLLQSEHAGVAVRLYASEEAFTILQEGEGRNFPTGSIIVKEKLLNPDDTKPMALGMMIKREAGFDPNAGDWEFAYWIQDGGLIEGNEALSNCVQCHHEQATTDMVFWEQ